MPFFKKAKETHIKKIGAYQFDGAEENLLGSGGFGKVYQGKECASGDKVAVKVVEVKGSEDIWEIMEEIRIMGVAKDHPNIVQLLAHEPSQKKGPVFVVMELADGGPLFHHVVNSGTLDERAAAKFFSQILRGVDFLHSIGIVHRDLKLENILLSKGDLIKICDLGLAHMFKKDDAGQFKYEKLKEKVGSKSYTAPEVLDGKGYDGFASDIWSIGICLFCALCGFFPLDVANRSDYRFEAVYQCAKKGGSVTATLFELYERGDPLSYLSSSSVDVLDGMMAISMTKRITMKNAIAHKWFRRGCDPTYRGAGGSDGVDAAAEAEMQVDMKPMGPPPGKAMGLSLQNAGGARAAGVALP